MPRPPAAARRYAHSLAAALTGNAQAFGYSIAITVSYAATTRNLGTPSLLDLLLFALAAVLAFTVLQLGAVALATREVEMAEPDRIRLIATATDVFAVGLAVLAAAGVSAVIGSWIGWALASFCASVLYVLVQALELRVAEDSAD